MRVQEGDANKPACHIIVAGGDKDKVPLASVDFQGNTRWSLELSATTNAPMTMVQNAVVASQRPWLALSLQPGDVRVVDLEAGKEIARVPGGGQGLADVAWLPVEGDAPLLIVATTTGLHAYRVNTAQAEKP